MSLGGINQEENLARYIFSKTHFSPSKMLVKYAAFLPRNNRLSVSRISGLLDIEIWRIGENIGRDRRERLKARADIRVFSVFESKLSIEVDEPPSRHADIINWPAEYSYILLKATELALKATLNLKR